MARLNFGDGENWVEVKDIDLLTEGDRKRVARAISLGVEGQRGIVGGSYIDDMRDAMYQVIVLDWSFREVLPHKSLKGLNNLPIAMAKELAQLTLPWFKVLTGGEDEGDENPTKPESES